MYNYLIITIALIAVCVAIAWCCPLPGTSRFANGPVLEGMISKPSVNCSYPFAAATHPPTDFAVEKQAEIARENERLSEKIHTDGTRELHQLSEGATCIDPLSGYDVPCTHAPSNVCSLG